MKAKNPQIGVCQRPVRHQIGAFDALTKSLTRGGWRVRQCYDATVPEPVAICWGWGKAKEIRAKHPDTIILCCDHGYTRDRKQYVNTGWSTPDRLFGLNGFAEHAVVRDGGSRLRRKGWADELKARVASTSRELMFFGQVYGDAMIVDHVEDYSEWLKTTIAGLTSDGWHVSFRPHPQMVFRGNVARYGNVGRMSTEPDFYRAMEGMQACAAMNSNALIQGFFAGYEAMAWNKGTMLWPLIERPGAAADFARRDEWAGMLAWCQWTYDELEDGTWLKYHEPILKRLIEGDSSRPWHEVVV